MSDRARYALNLVVAAALLAANAWQFLLLPALFLPENPWWLLTLVPLALISNSQWFLMHEAVHNMLLPDRRWNEKLGKAVSVAFGAPFEVPRFGHLMHHRFNGALVDRPDLYDPQKTSKFRVAVSYYGNILGGLYLGEFLSAGLFFLPKGKIRNFIRGNYASAEEEAKSKIGEQAEKMLLKDETVRSIRVQGAFIYGLLIASMLLYGAYWYAPLLILLVRAFFISFANNLPHYATTNQDPKYGLNLSMPRALHLFYLNFYHHRAHHHAPIVPWTNLPETFWDKGMAFDKPLLAAALAQFRGPMTHDRVGENSG